MPDEIKHPVPPLVEMDFAEIEKRVMAQMAEAFGVPDKMVRHGLNYEGKGTVTGRFSGPKPNFREQAPSKIKD